MLWEVVSEQLKQTCEAYHEAQSKHNLLLMDLEKLSLQRLNAEGENWTNKPVPTKIKELKFLDDFDQHKESKEKLVRH